MENRVLESERTRSQGSGLLAPGDLCTSLDLFPSLPEGVSWRQREDSDSWLVELGLGWEWGGGDGQRARGSL